MAEQIYVRIIKNKFQELKEKSPQKAGQALRQLALEGVSIARESMLESPATGRDYARGGRTHTASSPGNPPRVDMGNLINTLHIENRGSFSQAIIAGGGAEGYAEWLEFGTTKMAARPFMGPMALEVERLVPRVFDKFLEDEV